MPTPKKYLADLNEDNIYHIFNRTNGRELLYLTDENRRFFLQKFDEFLSPFLNTYAYCLLPNHFHFLVKIKACLEIKNYLAQLEKLSELEAEYFYNEQPSAELLSNAFKNFFASYAMGFNVVNKRKGNLFHRQFKRIEVVKESHFTQGLVYVHANPRKHRICKDFTCYPWSSYQTLISDQPTTLLREEIMDWFGGRENFIQAHRDLSEYYYESDIAIEK